jgi:hypothetical protein
MSSTEFSPDNFPDDLIPAAEAAKDLQLQESTLAAWRSLGRGPDFWKLGRAIFYSRRVNREWKARQRRSPRQRPESAQAG